MRRKDREVTTREGISDRQVMTWQAVAIKTRKKERIIANFIEKTMNKGAIGNKKQGI